MSGSHVVRNITNSGIHIVECLDTRKQAEYKPTQDGMAIECEFCGGIIHFIEDKPSFGRYSIITRDLTR